MILTPAQINDLLRGHTLVVDGIEVECRDAPEAQDAWVPAAPIQSAIRASDLSAVALAASIGWDESRIRGIMRQENMQSDTAHKIADALGLDPVDLGF